MDVTTGISWIGYANETLRKQIAPVIAAFIAERLPPATV